MNRLRTGVWLAGVASIVAVQPTWANPGPAATVEEWMAQMAQAPIVQITGVQLNPMAEGVEIILETNDQPLSPTTSVMDNALIIDIPSAVLVLPEGDTFEVTNPADDIVTVSATTLPENQVRLVITGTNAPPTAEISTTAFGLVLSIVPRMPMAEIEEEPIELVVTAKREEDDYYAPNASTATRTEVPILDIPASIQVIPEQVLNDQQVIRLDEALRNNVSGVVADSTEGAGFQFGLRGFQFAKILRDGFSLSGSDALSNTGILTLPEIANVERIEVLKGPASILYGEIQPGGVINLVTEQPTVEPLYEAELQLGSRSFIRPQLDFSDRLSADGRLRYRLNSLLQRGDGFRDFDQSIEREFITPVVTWNIDDQTDLTLDFEYLRDERPNDSGLLAFGEGIIDVPRDRIVGEPDDVVERGFFAGGYRLEHRFSDSWRIRNAFRYSSQNLDSNVFLPIRFDEASGTVFRLNGATDLYQDHYSLQTNLVGNFETGSIGHTLLFGVDVSRSFSDISARVNFPNLELLNIFNPAYGNAQRLPFEQLPAPARVQEVTTSRLGIFLQDQVDLFENLIFLAGVRYDTVSQDVANAPSLFDPTGREVSQTVDAFIPRLGLVYQPIPELSLYTSYSRSFTPSSATNLAGDLLEPEEGEGFEIGLKTELFDQRLIATLAYFDITKQNVATLDPNAPPFVNASVATGEQRSQGVELDLLGEILPGWNVVANYAYTDARVTQDNAIPVGNDLAGIPEHSASLWTTYTLQAGNLAGLGFGIGLNYVSERQGDLNNSFRLDDYLIANAAIFYERNDFKLALNFKNLFDTNYIQGTPISRIRGIEPGEPFTVIGSLSFQF